jgi:hypothetical protein
MQLATRPLLITLCTVVATVALISQSGYMLMLVFVVPLWLAWVLYCLWKMVRSPNQRATRAICIGLWVVGFMVIAFAHERLAYGARMHANAIVSQIKAHHDKNGHYPATLEVQGITTAKQEAAFGRKGFLYTLPDTNQPEHAFELPIVRYRSTENPFDWYFYDFQANEWVYRPD